VVRLSTYWQFSELIRPLIFPWLHQVLFLQYRDFTTKEPMMARGLITCACSKQKPAGLAGSLRYTSFGVDPKEVHGEDFPGKTFRLLKEQEIKQFSEYRTRRLVLETWDRMFPAGSG
jgi:hypothetical protein